MLRPMLAIGVGGSGGKTLQLLHRELRWRLRERGWNEGVPQGWQFIHIDVPAVPDTMLGDEAYLVSSAVVGGTYVGLAKRSTPYRSIDEVWMAGASSAEMATAATWRPDPLRCNVPLTDGAGQYRAVGRVVSLSQAAAIRNAITAATNRMADPVVQPQLQRLTTHLGGEAAAVDAEPRAVIVSSMAGGSGAGMFLDVADVLRSQGAQGWFDQSIGILYTADVFADIPELSRQGVMPNSLAALCELMNGYWNTSQPGAEYGALNRGGVAAAGFHRRGVRYPLLVGKSNGRVQFTDQRSVYEASAKTLAAFLTSPTAYNSINAYLRGNWSVGATALTDRTPFKSSQTETVTSAMGSGSLSLGRERFARYSAQRLARSAIEHCVRAHTVGRKVPEEMTFEAARDEAVMSQLNWFIDACRLDEIGPERNQVLDELRPDPSEAAAAVRTYIRSHLSQFPTANPGDYARVITEDAEHLRSGYVATTDEQLREKARLWVDESAARVEAVVLESIARSGLEVTHELLRRLIHHVDEVVNDLNGEIPRLQNNEGRLEEGVWGALQTWGENAMLADNELLQKAVQRVVQAFGFGLEARLRVVARDLLDDYARNYLRPLQEAVGHGLSGMRHDEHPGVGTLGAAGSADETALDVSAWPVDDIVPEVLQPADNERLVESTSDYPDTYVEQLVTTLQEPNGPRLTGAEAERRAVGEIVTGRARDLDARRVLVAADRWWPKLLGTQAPPSVARFELNVRAIDLLDRADRWVHRRDTGFGEYVSTSLRDFVEVEDPGLRAERRTRVLDAFQELLSVAQPLVHPSNSLMQAVHGDLLPSQMFFTSIPFAQTDLAPELLAVARSTGQPQDVVDRLSDSLGVGDEQRVEIISMLGAPVQPVVLESVLGPIASQWVSARGDQRDRSSFWQWRRARALPQFAPLSPEVLDAMVRGWFLARLFGSLTWNGEDVATGPVAIFDPEANTTRDFPHPLVGDTPMTDQDLMPAVIESLGIAMVECHTLGSLSPLRPYHLLRSWGEGTGFGDQWPQIDFVSKWITTGKPFFGREPLARAWRPPQSDVDSAATAKPEHRKDALAAYFQGRLRYYVERLDEEPVSQANLLVQPRFRDLHHVLAAAFSQLVADVERVQIIDHDDENSGD